MPVLVINLTNADDTYTSAAGDYAIDALDGNNTITTGAGNSTVLAGDGNDTITTGAGDNIVNAGAGNNTITTGAGHSTVITGDGNDTITTGAGYGSVSAGNGNNTITTGAGNFSVTSGTGDDTITTGAGDDLIFSGSGADIVNSAAGNDVLIYALAENMNAGFNGNATYVGGTGVDTLRLALTRAEWMSSAIQADVANYLAFLSANTGAAGEANATAFTFNTFGLTASMFEKLEVTVDGVSIDPTNHAVTLGNDTVSTSENVSSALLNVLANDAVPDLIKSLINTNPAHGSVQLTPDYVNTAASPSATFVYTPDAGFYDYLAVGESASDEFTYTVTDASGDVKTATVKVTVTGTNDAPTITVASTDAIGGVTEDAAAVTLSDTGSIVFNDIDLTDAHTFGIAANASNTLGGSLTLGTVVESASTEAGSVGWTYNVANSAVQYLALGQTSLEKFTVTVADGHGGSTTQEVLVTVTGTNDVPVVAITDLVGNVSELTSTPGTALLTDSGTIEFNDVDVVDIHRVSSVTSVGALGTLVVSVSSDSTGGSSNGVVAWSYSVADSSVEYLTAGQTKHETFSFNVIDSQGASITRTVDIVILGTNDKAIINGTSSGSVAEDSIFTTTGTLTVSDVDSGESVFRAQSNTAGTYGKFSIDAQGVWGYVLNNSAANVQALNTSDRVNDSFTVLSQDGTAKVVSVGVAGLNDIVDVIGTKKLKFDASSGAIDTYSGFNFTARDSIINDTPDWYAAAGQSYNGSAGRISDMIATNGTDFSVDKLDIGKRTSSNSASEVDIKGFNNGIEIYSKHVVLTVSMKTVALDFVNIDDLQVIVTVGSNSSGYGYWQIDNIFVA